MSHTLSEALLRHAEKQPNAIAAREGSRTLSYSALASLVELWQQSLLLRGFTKGQRVAVLTTPGIDYYVSLLAVTGLGGIWLGLNPRATYDELDYLVIDSEPSFLFYRAKFEGRTYQPDFERLSVSRGIPAIALNDAWPGGGGQADLEGARSGVRTEDAAVIVYTSGSTGQPKGAQLSHEALITGAAAQNRRWGMNRVDQLCFSPINHVMCTGDVVATTLLAGGALTFQPRFDAGEAIAAYRRGEANIILAVPTMLQMILDHGDFSPDALAGIELIVWGGAPLARDRIEALAGMGPRLATIYGMTEAAANTTYTDERATLEELITTVGKPLPEFPTRLMDGDRICGPNEPGEIQHRLSFTRLGYWRRPDATREVTTIDGWYRSGDLGQWGDDGNLRLVGRLKDMFKSGGYNIYPREIEIALERHPDIVEAIVVDIPDPLYQEVGVAFVRPRSVGVIDEEGVIAHARSCLSNYKIPKKVLIRDSFPLLPVGKVDKPSLRAEARALFADAR